MGGRLGSKVDFSNAKIDSQPMHHIVFITAPGLEVARELSAGILERRLAACANLVPGVESHYWWEGKVCNEAEVLMILKTTENRLAELEAHVLEAHPYDTPEFVTWPIARGSKKYLDWLTENTGLRE